MDAYVFLNCECGKVTSVMDAVVAAGAARAVALTGTYDVAARIEDVSFEGLTTFCIERLGAIDGVTASSTSVVVTSLPSSDIPKPPLPFRGTVAGRAGLVFVSIVAGAAEDVLASLSASDAVDAFALLTGDHDLLVQVEGASVEDIAKAVLSDVQSLPGVLSTSTSLVLAATPATAS